MRCVQNSYNINLKYTNFTAENVFFRDMMSRDQALFFEELKKIIIICVYVCV